MRRKSLDGFWLTIEWDWLGQHWEVTWREGSISYELHHNGLHTWIKTYQTLGEYK